MQVAHTTEFIVDTPDYFSAYTDNDGIRFGLVSCQVIDIPKDHKAAPDVLACTNSDQIEEVFDNFLSGFYK